MSDSMKSFNGGSGERVVEGRLDAKPIPRFCRAFVMQTELQEY
jgi:hypothetical protein